MCKPGTSFGKQLQKLQVHAPKYYPKYVLDVQKFLDKKLTPTEYRKVIGMFSANSAALGSKLRQAPFPPKGLRTTHWLMLKIRETC
jgi:hypothetical protein